MQKAVFQRVKDGLLQLVGCQCVMSLATLCCLFLLFTVAEECGDEYRYDDCRVCNVGYRLGRRYRLGVERQQMIAAYAM